MSCLLRDCQPGMRSEDTEADKDLYRGGSQDLRPSRMGSRVWHNRFPDHAGPSATYSGCEESFPARSAYRSHRILYLSSRKVRSATTSTADEIASNSTNCQRHSARTRARLEPARCSGALRDPAPEDMEDPLRPGSARTGFTPPAKLLCSDCR